MKYTFGHTTLAAERLKRIADFFDPYSHRFVQSGLNAPVGAACDLGCGPGYTTRMLHKVSKAKRICGIDFSDEFINLAKAHYPGYNFINHDVTYDLGSEKYDLIYSRFLLSHIDNIADVIALWKASLNRSGKIFIDELEDIYTEVPVFKKYLQISGALVKSKGAVLFIGKEIDASIGNFNVASNYSEIIKVPDRTAAGWFFPNTTGVWETSDTVNKMLDKAGLKAIHDQLFELMHSASECSRITWKMKRIIIAK